MDSRCAEHTRDLVWNVAVKTVCVNMHVWLCECVSVCVQSHSGSPLLGFIIWSQTSGFHALVSSFIGWLMGTDSQNEGRALDTVPGGLWHLCFYISSVGRCWMGQSMGLFLSNQGSLC